ncbi:MAG: PIN domain-containing protein [Defluviitaleaceae bacterium]|nr:PIN domain-containing protein [Defluviitaleaceae bacterium]
MKRRKKKLYLDTSVISHLDQRDVPEKMQQTQELWEVFKTGKYDIVISEVAFGEIDKCPTEKRKLLYNYIKEISYIEYATTEETDEIAEQIIAEKILARKHLNDCYHIASAILTECDILLSWNFDDLANAKTVDGARRIKYLIMGNTGIDIYPPHMLLEKES